MVRRVHVLVLLLLVLSSRSLAQSTLTALQNRWGDDCLQRHAVGYVFPGGEGQQMWDFSDLELSDSPVTTVFRKDSCGGMTVEGDGQLNTFIFKNDTLLHTGMESPLQQISYRKPAVRLMFPLAYGDSTTVPFSGEGVYCGDHPYRESGQVTLLADAYGDAVIPNGDTLHNVLRLYSLRSYSICMGIDTVDLDTAQLRQVIEERYEWYARGYRYPVFETLTSTSYANMRPIGTRQTAFCCLPNFQCQLPDSVNRDILRQDSLRHEQQKDIIHYQVSVHGGMIDFTYDLDGKAEITLLVSSSIGIVYRRQHYSQPAGKGCQAQIDCNGLRRGQYILYINVNGRVYSRIVTI